MRVGRIVLLVRNFQDSLKFYEEVLGLRLVRASTNWAEFRSGDVLICLHGPWNNMPFRTEDFGRAPDELTFLVPNLDEAITALASRGVTVEEPHSPGPGIFVAEFADPDGRRLALECRTP